LISMQCAQKVFPMADTESQETRRGPPGHASRGRRTGHQRAPKGRSLKPLTTAPALLPDGTGRTVGDRARLSSCLALRPLSLTLPILLGTGGRQPAVQAGGDVADPAGPGRHEAFLWVFGSGHLRQACWARCASISSPGSASGSRQTCAGTSTPTLLKPSARAITRRCAPAKPSRASRRTSP
jgi:hypothetical protein